MCLRNLCSAVNFVLPPHTLHAAACLGQNETKTKYFILCWMSFPLQTRLNHINIINVSLWNRSYLMKTTKSFNTTLLLPTVMITYNSPSQSSSGENSSRDLSYLDLKWFHMVPHWMSTQISKWLCHFSCISADLWWIIIVGHCSHKVVSEIVPA